MFLIVVCFGTNEWCFCGCFVWGDWWLFSVMWWHHFTVLFRFHCQMFVEVECGVVFACWSFVWRKCSCCLRWLRNVMDVCCLNHKLAAWFVFCAGLVAFAWSMMRGVLVAGWCNLLNVEQSTSMMNLVCLWNILTVEKFSQININCQFNWLYHKCAVHHRYDHQCDAQ